MNNPTRRNRNIGSSKQGHGHNNKLVIPQPGDTLLEYYERFQEYAISDIVVGKGKITVIKEKLKHGYYYSCTPQDAEKILSNLPPEDIAELKYIVFRQPKRKENVLQPVWGRLIYSLQFKNDCGAAIIIEAVNESEWYRFPKKHSIEDALEFELLKEDGLSFEEGKKDFIATIDRNLVRNIQLYRTLLHEVGHYSHYLTVVERPGTEDESMNKWEHRNNEYFRIPRREKEDFANRYAKKMKTELLHSQTIPFERIEE